ncbi:MAG: 50S ribosomal protein L4 [Gammaproteobacteria bacterium]|nr:50S ribosomal protein L4 [Gammaproteobacteria bacterium]
MKLSVMKDGGAKTADMDVSDVVFGAAFNEDLVHQIVIAYQANGRQGSRAQKNRSAVSGGGIKPWRQKGTGRARAGTIRSPIWRGGGKVFPSSPDENFSQKVNKKVHRAGMRSILSELARLERLVAVEDMAMAAPKTRELAGKLAAMKAEKSVLIVTETEDRNLVLSARNLPYVSVCVASAINPVNLVGHEQIIMTTGAVKRCEEMLA